MKMLINALFAQDLYYKAVFIWFHVYYKSIFIIKLCRLLKTSKVQAVVGASEITGDLADDFTESKPNVLLMSGVILCGLCFSL